MKAIYLNQAAGPESLTVGELDQPQPGAGEVLVKVSATAVTPTEFSWFPTFHTRAGGVRPFPVVPGHEFSGTVAALGAGVTDFHVGDAVYGVNDWFANGALAEYTVAPAKALAPKPVSLTHAQAAVVPISALTAWQALFSRVNLFYGQRVLIHGAAGAVGIFAVQLARARGAHVIATASASDLDFVRRLGADEVIDYRATRFENVVHDIDLVLDTVGGETLERSWSVLRPGGRIVTIATASAGATEPRVREAFMVVEPGRSQLAEIAHRIDTGELHVPAGRAFPLYGAKAAFARAAQGHMRGKIALQVANLPAPLELAEIDR